MSGELEPNPAEDNGLTHVPTSVYIVTETDHTQSGPASQRPLAEGVPTEWWNWDSIVSFLKTVIVLGTFELCDWSVITKCVFPIVRLRACCFLSQIAGDRCSPGIYF